MASPRTERITISCTTIERTEIEKRAKAWKNVSEFLVGSAIPDRESLEAFVNEPDNVSLDTIRRALNSGSLPESYLERLPKELQEAVEDYRSAVRRGNGDVTGGDSREGFIPKQIPELEGGFQSEVLQGLVLLPDLGERDEIPDAWQVAGAHLVRPGLISGKRVLYLFPFFRSPARRPSWGVIAYGCHEKIGLLLRRDVFSDFLGKTIEEGSAARGWLSLVIDRLCGQKNELRIGFRESYFEEEAAEVIWSRAAQSKFGYAFEARREPIPPEEFDFSAKRKPRKGGDKKETRTFKALLDDKQIGILVFDLGFEAQIKKAAGKEWEIVQFPHGIRVPVGIGFSLSFLPRLLVHDNWKKILGLASNALPKIRDDLVSSGISLPTTQENSQTK